MSWPVIALSSAAIAGIVHILEKTALFRYIHSPLTLPFLIGLTQLSVGTVLTLALPWPGTPNLYPIGWALLSGALHGLGGLILLRVLFSQEVSRVIPVFLTFPIFAALIAVIFLDERLSLFNWVAILATVAGAILLSVRHDQKYRGLFLHPSFYVLIVGSAITAGGHVTGKIALDDLSVLNAHGLRALGAACMILLASLRPVAVQEVRDLLRQRSPAIAIVGLDQILVSIVLLLILWALSLGPVSLVTAVSSTRALFVLFYSTALALRFRGFLGEQVSVGAVAVKVVSTALIVGGVATITLR